MSRKVQRTPGSAAVCGIIACLCGSSLSKHLLPRGSLDTAYPERGSGHNRFRFDVCDLMLGRCSELAPGLDNPSENGQYYGLSKLYYVQIILYFLPHHQRYAANLHAPVLCIIQIIIVRAIRACKRSTQHFVFICLFV